MATLDARFVLVRVAGFLSAVEYKRILKPVSKAVNLFDEDRYVSHHPLHGAVIRTNRSLGRPMRIVTQYREGIKHGPCREWYCDALGSLQIRAAERTFVNGSQEGLYRDWHPNSAPSQQYTIVKGVLHGSHYSWYSNGQIRFKGWRAHGNLHGLQLVWYITGQLRRATQYGHGKILSSRAWNPNGELTVQ